MDLQTPLFFDFIISMVVERDIAAFSSTGSVLEQIQFSATGHTPAHMRIPGSSLQESLVHQRGVKDTARPLKPAG